MTVLLRRAAACVAFLLAASAQSGCGGGNSVSPPKTVPVSGSVLVKGKPVAGVTVKFLPQFDIGEGLTWQPNAVTDKDGKFVLSTGADGNGAPPGEYKVTFEFLQTGADKHGLDTEFDAWKGKYTNPETAKPVTITAAGGELEAFKLD